MSEHLLLASKDLVAALKMLGTSLGYTAETEFPIDRRKVRPQAIDVAWMKDKDQRFPLMVFEVESTASNAAANNPLKVYAKRNFEKPLFFFHVFINAGKTTARLDDLREEYGRLNYRAYTICDSGPGPLLNDILSQHRRLTDRLDVVAFIDVLRRTCLAGVDCHAVLKHTENLGFNGGRGSTLPSYALLGAEEPSFTQDFYRYLTMRRNGGVMSETDRYSSYLGQNWPTPLHLGILSSLQPEPASPGYFDKFRGWHEEPAGQFLRVGPWFGLNMDFDDFLAYYSAPFFTLLAVLMADVPGSAHYLADQLATVLREVRGDCLAVRSHLSSWMLHLYSTDPHSVSEFEALRECINSSGGIAERFLNHPFGGVPFAHLDPETDEAFHIARVTVPPFSVFHQSFIRSVDGRERRTGAVRLAMRVLSVDETLASWEEGLLPLLHSS